MWTRPTRWYRVVAALLSAALLVTACSTEPEQTATGPGGPGPMRSGGCSGTGKPGGSAEGEVYGSFFQNGLRVCNTVSISLNPYADAQSHLYMPGYKASLTASYVWANMFEFWDPRAGGPCTPPDLSLATYLVSGSGKAEVAHDNTSGNEGHCARPGKYYFTDSQDDGGFDVDYIATQYMPATIMNTTNGHVEAIENAVYDSAGRWNDLVIFRDQTTTHPGDTPVLMIENAGGTPSVSSFADQASPSGTAADWFLFSTSSSVSNWAIDTRGQALARLYFNGNDLTQTTGYYSYVPEGVGIIRVHQFPNPTTATKVDTVGLELMRPDESPANAPSVTRTITLTRINPDLAPGTIDTPPATQQGGSRTITLTERNLGSQPRAPVEAGWTGKIYLSTDTVCCTGDVLLTTFTETDTIPAGGTLSKQRSITIPSGQTPGTYRLIGVLDANGTVLESNESNNTIVSGAFSVTAPPPVACATFEGTTTWEVTDQIFDGTCSSGGPLQYQWQLDAGGGWTGYSSTPTFQSVGYTTAGTHQVTLQVKNTVSGLTATHTYPIVVQSGQLVLTGPTFITAKGTYTYFANDTATWWERQQPTTTWVGGTVTDTVWHRTWMVGCYTMDVRGDASAGGVLKRGRLTVNVASDTHNPNCLQ